MLHKLCARSGKIDKHLGGVTITWELFKTTFLGKFFSRDMRKAKVEKFMNLKQGSMIVREYSLMFLNYKGILLLLYITAGMIWACS